MKGANWVQAAVKEVGFLIQQPQLPFASGSSEAAKNLCTVAGQQQQRQSHIWGRMGAAQPQAWTAGHAASSCRSGRHMGSRALVPLNCSACLALPYMCVKKTACMRRRFKNGSRFKGQDRGLQSAGRSKLEGLGTKQDGAGSHHGVQGRAQQHEMGGSCTGARGKGENHIM